MGFRTLYMPGGGEDPTPPAPPDLTLDEIETRVAGALIEKEITTPDYYPMTRNALVAACNQKNNRDPVTSYDESQVEEALERLKDKHLVFRITGAEHRVPKFRHVFTDAFRLKPPENAVVAALMLRGPQTPGELRGNAGRLHEFASLAEVEETLHALAARERPLVAVMERQPGMREARWRQLIGEVAAPAPRAGEAANPAPASGNDLEERVARLESEVAALREQLERFRRQFE